MVQLTSLVKQENNDQSVTMICTH